MKLNLKPFSCKLSGRVVIVVLGKDGASGKVTGLDLSSFELGHLTMTNNYVEFQTVGLSSETT